MKVNIKRNAVIVTVLVFVCVAVYLNWSYNNRLGEPDAGMVSAEDLNRLSAENAYEASSAGQDEVQNVDEVSGEAEEISMPDPVSDYFASARLTRQKTRDEALGLLQQAAMSESASQEIIDGAMNELSDMANYSMREAQIENLLIAKEFADCVVFISGNGITVAVPAPEDGLAASSVARITDVITNETELAASQIRLIEVKG